jgi:hypothetical protein
MGPWQDNYDPARLLLLDKIRQPKIKGDPVILIPNRDSLLLTGSKDPKGLLGWVQSAHTGKNQGIERNEEMIAG